MMGWSDIAELYRYWRDAPPVHELVALAVGFKPAPRDIDASGRINVGMTYHEIEAAMAKGTPFLAVGA